MTNPDQVTLDEMALELIKWVSDGLHWVDDSNRIRGKGPLLRKKPEDLYTSLDVIREVEEALNGELEEEYIKTLRHSVIDFDYATSISYGDVFKCATADPETRLRAIYQTLRESGEI